MEFKIVLTDDDYNKITLTDKWDNGDWKDIRFALKIMYLEQYISEEELLDAGKYEVSILAVSPTAAKKKGLDSAISCMGFDDEGYESFKKFPLYKYEALIEYGTFAQLWYKQGDNLEELIEEAKKEFMGIKIMFGFYMDRNVNMIGDTGWDAIRGEIGSRLFKRK